MNPPDAIDYNAHWAESLDTYRNHPTSRHRRRFVMNALRHVEFTPSSFVFDYGCGAGLILEEAQQLFALEDSQLGGCDVSETAINIVSNRFRSQHFHLGEYPDEPRPIDVAVCTEVIEHTADYERILRWLYEHVRSGGHLILTTPGTPMDPPDMYYGHIQHFELSTLTGLLSDIGFSIDYARRWGYPLFSLQKWITKRHFDRVKAGFMEGELSLKKRLVFSIAYGCYFVHDWIAKGPQIFIRARRR